MRPFAPRQDHQGRRPEQRRDGRAVLVADMGNSWRERAACRGIDTGLFFIERSDPDASTKLAEAKSICGRCPVREECAKAGRNESLGVWGGLTVEERMGPRARKIRMAG